MTDPEFHPIAGIFPLMDGQPFADLVNDIRLHGLREPIWMYDGKILDGRNRYRACQAAGVDPVFADFNGDYDQAYRFSISLNLHRRHLTDDQRKTFAADDSNATRNDFSGNRHTKRENLECSDWSTLDNQKTTRTDASELWKVSVRGIEEAKRIKKTVEPEIYNLVKSGDLKLAEARRIGQNLSTEQQLAILKKEDPKAVQQAAKELRAEKETQRREQRLASLKAMAEPKPELKTGQKYSVIYADPPWQYERPVSDSRKIENQYPVMSLDDIKALPVSKLATDAAILYLWATSPKLEESMQVMNAWGFSYRSCAVWDKEVMGMGYWFRQQTELLLVGIRGAMPSPEPSRRVSSLITSRRGRHSQKPECVYSMIESMYPELPRIELFSRQQRPGWASFGNQCHG